MGPEKDMATRVFTVNRPPCRERRAAYHWARWTKNAGNLWPRQAS